MIALFSDRFPENAVEAANNFLAEKLSNEGHREIRMMSANINDSGNYLLTIHYDETRPELPSFLITNKQLRNARRCCGYSSERMAAALDYPLRNYLAFESGEMPIPVELTAERLLVKIRDYHKSIADTLARLVVSSGASSK